MSDATLHSSESTWPEGTHAAVFGQNYLTPSAGTWQMVAELDGYAIPWHCLDDLSYPLIYVPRGNDFAESILKSNGWSRCDNTPLDWIFDPLVDGYERGRLPWLRFFLPRWLR